MIGHGGLLRKFSHKGFWVCLGDLPPGMARAFRDSGRIVPILTKAEGNSIHPT